jgi:hypothetical protein
MQDQGQIILPFSDAAIPFESKHKFRFGIEMPFALSVSTNSKYLARF